MYSVDDLLISHGYKLAKTSVPCPSSTSSATAPCEKKRHVAATTDCHREIPAAENQRPGRVGSLNGYEQAGDRGACVFRSSSRQALLAKAYPGSGDNESGGERNQRRKEAGSGNLGDSLAQPLGDSLATDSGFYDAPSLTYSEQLEERDVSYWRRRGQDFSVLLDYADGRELRASASFLKASEVAWRPQALIAEDHRGEREKQQQKQLWDDTSISWLREADAAPGQLRVLTGVTGERKCQSLGTEEWKPAVGLGRQLSDGEGERWAQDQQHRLRTPESAGSVLPRTRGKSQSLPRVLSPDGTTEHTDTQSSLVSVQLRPGQVDRQRVNSTVFSGPYSRYYHSAAVGRDRWARNSWQSGGHVALLPKPRFSRPVKPPSYEIHQQTRGSQEMLSVAVVDEQGWSKQQKDNRPIYHPRGGELQRQDYFAQHSAIFGMEPPGYIPPPSYKRAPPPIRGGPINRNEVVNYKWRGEMQIQMQMPVSSEAGRWFSRQTGGSWLEHYGDRGIPYRKQVNPNPNLNPGYTEEHLGHVHYLPFDDLRELKLSGSWPGNQYRDQETQTSPEARKRQPPPPPPPGPENKEAQDPQVPAPGTPDPGVTPDPSGVGSTAFSYPIKGVKSLKPSSNSAFSRTATFSIASQLNKSTVQPPAAAPPPPPSGNTTEAKPAAACSGQFLLKPVSRRPWDAIEELEPINKELQDQQQQQQHQQSSKRPSVDQCIEDLNEAYKDILELGTASNNVPNNGGAVQIPERIKIRLAGEAGLSKPSSLRRSIESWTVSVDPEYREVKSAFSRPAERKSVTFSKQLREELPVPPRDPTGFREYRVVSNLSQRRSSCSGRSVKLDLSSPSETPPPCDFTGPSEFIDSPSDPSEIRDLSPTTPTTHTAAEVPWADRQPMQDASTLTSPPDYEDICQSLQKTRDSKEVNKTLTAKSKLGGGRGNTGPPGGTGLDSEEECPICKKESESQMSRPSPMSPLHEESSPDLSDQSSATIVGDNGSPQGPETSEEPAEDEGDTKVSSDSCSNHSEAQTLCQGWREQLSLTDDKNVGGSATAEKTNQNQALAVADDLNNLYEVKCAEGIPENESIEERAARILGIDVPAESLVTEEQRAREPATEEIELTESEPTAGEDPERSSANEQTVQKHVRDTESGELGSTVSTVPDSGQELQEKEQPQDTPERIRSAKWTHLGRETPGMLEFPPDRLPLSVPINPDQKLSHSLEGERRGRGASQHIEALQDKLAASPSHQVAIEHLARMKVVDSVSRMRLSIRSTDSGEGGEADGEAGGEARGGVEQVEESAVLPAPSQSDTVDDREVKLEDDREVKLEDDREVKLEDDREASEDTVLQDEEVSSVSEA
ncbi:hypothetical protein J4Q44_G00191730 [Coregonus suidteri]|uniref:Junctional protein associated with coronary artery disease n=1 Tax=Coregonus suidteri TaxID=861788 RepID=A0AAN8QUB2_9TELE